MNERTVISEGADVQRDDAVTTADRIADEIHLLRHLYNSRLYTSVRDGEDELSYMAGRFLVYIAAHPGASNADLVVRFARDKAQVARLVADLRQRDLVTSRADPARSRGQCLFLTGKGMDVRQEVQSRRREVLAAAVSNFTSDEQAMLVTMLERLRHNLEPAR